MIGSLRDGRNWQNQSTQNVLKWLFTEREWNAAAAATKVPQMVDLTAWWSTPLQSGHSSQTQTGNGRCKQTLCVQIGFDDSVQNGQNKNFAALKRAASAKQTER